MATSDKIVREMLDRMDKVADWQLDPDDKRIREQVGADIGCAAITITTYMKDDRYLAILKAKTKVIVKNLTPVALKGLKILLAAGNPKTVLWFFEQTGVFEDDVTMTDKEILNKVISGDIPKDMIPDSFTSEVKGNEKE